VEAGYRNSLRSVIDAIDIDADSTVSWYGEPVDQKQGFPSDLLRDALEATVSGLLYQAYYVFGAPINDLTLVDEPASVSASARLMRTLVQASVGRGVWRHAGTRSMSPSGDAVVDVWGVKYIIEGSTTQPLVADSVASGTWVTMPGVLGVHSPGYIMFIGDEGPVRAADGRVVRIYWNVTSAGAPELVTSITKVLNHAVVPFQLKVRYSDNPWTSRADAAVLYLGLRDAETHWDDLRSIYRTVAPFLRSYTPALTRRLGYGVAAADDPGGNQSFGTEVCGLISRGLIAAHMAGVTHPDERLSAVLGAFGEAGRTLAAPYLSPGSADFPDSFSADFPSTNVGIGAGIASEREPDHDPDWVRLAAGIGAEVVRQALWDGARCTWLEPSLENSRPRAMRPAGAGLYSGTVGIGLFLAELWHQTGDDAYRECAHGALNHAAEFASALPRLGLHAGACGAGLGVAVAARALGDEQLEELGHAVTVTAARRALDGETGAAFDLLYGLSGAIVALVGLHRLGNGMTLELAADLGKLLIDTGRRCDAGIYWQDGLNGDIGLVGMAHGASGALWALTELGTETGEHAAFIVANLARSYELSWFDPASSNWPDVRGASGLRSRPSESGRNRYDWCYGAPGILVARMRLAQVAMTDATVNEVEIAAAGTRRAAESFPRFGSDVCLCHGAAGLAEILSLLPRTLATDDDWTVRQNLMSISLRSYRGKAPWPDGCGLMLGASGVGLAALRMAFPDTTSALFPIPT
jgi:Lanthionine synthetase C-like protein/HopA1 effector protein family